MTELKLPRQQQVVYDLLARSGDVSVVDLYLAVGGDPERADEHDDKSRSWAQSRVIQHIGRLNRRLKAHGLQVKPGRIKRTYCLVPSK